MVKGFRLLLMSVLLAWALVISLSPVAAKNENAVYVLRVEGAIVPAVADYLHRGLAEAVANKAQAVVVEINTPGGLVTSAQDIIEDFLASRIPVIVYVSPAGGWAGSAGAFITMASHVAAMAPGTFIGAAHPVTLGGAPGGPPSPQPSAPSAVEEKMVNALASSIRSVAEQRHRNVDVAEDMVRKSIAKTDSEALDLNIIEYRAESLQDLMEKVDGRKISLFGGLEATLKTKGAALVPLKMSVAERLLQTISDPNIAYLLLSLAAIAIFVELSNPGMILPGVVGGIGLLAGLYALGTLQANWTGIALILLAFGLFIADVFASSHGVLTAGGVASLVLGSLLLFPTPGAFQINLWLVAGVAGTITAFFVFVVTAIVRTQRKPQITGRDAMVGISALVKTPLAPSGTVFTHGELWAAVLDEGTAEPGEEVIVTDIEGLRLRVRKKKG
ncbi:MAG: nodulation protein NfeD [Chloroflexi bacterium]|nr:nodulation protein NfeD [Chloroflexota bacterium]